MKLHNKKRGIWLALVVISTLLYSCKKFITVDPPITATTTVNVYKNDASAIALMTNIYANLGNGSVTDGMLGLFSSVPALLADESVLFSTSIADRNDIYRNSYSSTNGVVTRTWNRLYETIYITNSVLSNLDASKTLTPKVVRQLKGEAKFIRALCYFQLVNYFGDVPLALTTDYRINAVLPRSPKDRVWKLILGDLQESAALSSGDFLTAALDRATEERVRPTKWSALALLARASLYMENYERADSAATAVIERSDLFELIEPNRVFLKNSREAIWQIQPTNANTYQNAAEGRYFILTPTGPVTYMEDQSTYLNENLIKAMELEPDNERLAKWISSVNANGSEYYFAYKYKIGSENTATQEYSTLFRIAEQYLIRAEAKAKLKDITGARLDLNAIRTRAKLGETSANDQSSLLTAIERERQVELFTEGHRWLDLKRWGKLDQIMSMAAIAKGGTWMSYKSLLPLPSQEISRNPALRGHQNPGYTN
jgi:hypothetical protein